VKAIVAKEEEEASLNSTLEVAELSFCGFTASHQMLLAPNTWTPTVVAAARSSLATAQPRKIAARMKKAKTLVVYMVVILQNIKYVLSSKCE
jgi:hypothetical protein